MCSNNCGGCSQSSNTCNCTGEIANLQSQIDAIVVGETGAGNGLNKVGSTINLGGSLITNTVLSSTIGSLFQVSSQSGSVTSGLTINPTVTDTLIFSHVGTLAHQYSQGEYGHRFIYNTAIPSRFRIEDVSIPVGGDYPAHNSLFIVEDTKYSRGVEYAGDYEANFVARSLVTKRYVDALVGTPLTFTNGLTKSGSTVELGGSLTEDTLINNSGFTFSISSSSSAEQSTIRATSGSSGLGVVINQVRNTASTIYSGDQFLIDSSIIETVNTGGAKRIILNQLSSTGIQVQDTLQQIGLRYSGDYSSNNSSNPRWITDKGYVDGAIATLATLQAVTTAGSTTTNAITINKLSSPATALTISNTNGTTGILFNGTGTTAKGSIIPNTTSLDIVSDSANILKLVGGGGVSIQASGANSVSLVTNTVSRLDIGATGIVSILTTPDTGTSADEFIVRDTTSGNLRRLPSSNVYFSTANYVMVKSLSDLPTPVAGVITLVTNTTYIILGSVNIGTNRLSAPNNVAIVGSSALSSTLTSTVSAQPLITSTGALECSSITLVNTSGTIFSCDASANPNSSLYCNRLNISGQSLGSIGNYMFMVFQSSILNNLTGGLSILGSNGVFVGDTVSFSTATSGVTIITVPASTTFSARMRIIYSTFSVVTGATAINVDVSATIPAQSFLLDTVNFTGAGTFLGGMIGSDNKALFKDCTGIANSRATSSYYMNDNATATVIGATDTYVKVAGTTTSASVTERFNNTVSNKSTYTGTIQRAFQVTVVASLNSGNNQIIHFAIFKNGTLITDSETSITTSASGAGENVAVQTFFTSVTNDYIEVYVKNNTAATNITVTDLNVAILEV